MALYYYTQPVNILDEFIKCGSGFELSADRLYDEEGEPLYYHLKMFGLHYPDDYELTGYDLEALMKEVIKDCEESMKGTLPPPFPEEEYRWLASCSECSWAVERALPYSAILQVAKGHEILSGHIPDIFEQDEGKEI